MQFCLVLDPDSGAATFKRARFGEGFLLKAKRKEKNTEKEPWANSPWHHPETPTRIKVVRGVHTIWTMVNGVAESITLQVGDEMLFMNLKPAGEMFKPEGSRPDHWSQPGAEGCELEIYVFETPGDVAVELTEDLS